MGLRLVAHYYDRSEALIACGALEAAGYYVNSVRPLHESAFGGYRLMAVEDEIPMAVTSLREARRKRSFEGGRLSKDHGLALTLLIFSLMWLPTYWFVFPVTLWLPLPRYRWRTAIGEGKGLS